MVERGVGKRECAPGTRSPKTRRKLLFLKKLFWFFLFVPNAHFLGRKKEHGDKLCSFSGVKNERRIPEV